MATEIGKYLKLLRIKTGDSLRAMAAKLKISPAYLSSIENGKRSIPENFLDLINSAYELNDQEKKKLKEIFYNSIDTYTFDLSNFSEKKREVLLSLAQEDLNESVIDKLRAVIKQDSDKNKRE